MVTYPCPYYNRPNPCPYYNRPNYICQLLGRKDTKWWLLAALHLGLLMALNVRGCAASFNLLHLFPPAPIEFGLPAPRL